MKESEFNMLREKAERDVEISETEKELLKPYQVDNAIIMAAGYSARCMPLSNVIPKGLFRVRGELLIEREIEQLLEAGIENIIVVTGFMHEKFEYMKDKYGVTLVYNKDFDKYNNMSSLYEAKQYMGNSYILCSDNYYENNVFHKYMFESCYSCIYSEQYCDEFCVTAVDGQNYIKAIHRGGEKSWYTIGDAFFDKAFSEKFCELMNEEWGDAHTRNMLMDDFHIKHIGELMLKKIERPGHSILEFDTLEEIKDYDPQFSEFIRENLDSSNPIIKTFTKYSDVKSYHSVPTEQLSGRLHLNENLFGPSPKCFEVIKKITMEDLFLYDLSNRDYLTEEISSATGISANNIFVHNGSSEVIKSIFSILLNEDDTVLVSAPGWSYYKSVADAKFAKCITYEVYETADSYRYNLEDLLEKAEKYHPKIIVMTTPHMPTGCGIARSDIEKVIRQHEDSVIMLDEAYWGYGDDTNLFEKEIITRYSNVVITRTFSKFYGLANIRIGYGICSYPLRRTIGLDLPLFRPCGISRRIALEAIKDTVYYKKLKQETIAVRDWFTDALNLMESVKAFRSESNFVFICLQNANADKVRAFMEENNILIRLFTDKDALRLRVTIGPKDVMERVLFQLKRALREEN